MKKLFTLVALAAFFSFGVNNYVYAQEGSDTTEAETEIADSATQAEAKEKAAALAAKAAEADNKSETEVKEKPQSFHQILKEKFIEGGAEFMGVVLLCLILGLTIVIERILYLNFATTNTKKLMANVEDAMNSGGIEAAKEVCRNTSGPVASVFYQGLSRSEDGIEMVEKSVIAYGSVQMGQLEKGVSWISLFIALAPMLGFMGTVIGMIGAFDAIEAAGDISPSLVAGGIKVALLTTVFGLIVAIILQVFYNYIIAKIDSIVNDMEDASISLIDLLMKNKLTNSKA